MGTTYQEFSDAIDGSIKYGWNHGGPRVQYKSNLYGSEQPGGVLNIGYTKDWSWKDFSYESKGFRNLQRGAYYSS